MTPKEKAKELISKFTFLKLPESDSEFYNPKQCALICVDEILNHFNINWTWMSNDIADKQLWKYEFVFWQEVKKELENL